VRPPPLLSPFLLLLPLLLLPALVVAASPRCKAVLSALLSAAASGAAAAVICGLGPAGLVCILMPKASLRPCSSRCCLEGGGVAQKWSSVWVNYVESPSEQKSTHHGCVSMSIAPIVEDLHLTLRLGGGGRGSSDVKGRGGSRSRGDRRGWHES
jgi:hypothetical protein